MHPRSFALAGALALAAFTTLPGAARAQSDEAIIGGIVTEILRQTFSTSRPGYVTHYSAPRPDSRLVDPGYSYRYGAPTYVERDYRDRERDDRDRRWHRSDRRDDDRDRWRHSDRRDDRDHRWRQPDRHDDRHYRDRYDHDREARRRDGYPDYTPRMRNDPRDLR